MHPFTDDSCIPYLDYNELILMLRMGKIPLILRLAKYFWLYFDYTKHRYQSKIFAAYLFEAQFFILDFYA